MPGLDQTHVVTRGNVAAADPSKLGPDQKNESEEKARQETSDVSRAVDVRNHSHPQVDCDYDQQSKERSKLSGKKKKKKGKRS